MTTLIRRLSAFFSLAAFGVFPAFGAGTINIVSLVPGEGQLRDKFIATEQRLEAEWSQAIDVVLLIDGQVGTEESMAATVRRDRAQIGMLTTAGTSSVVPEMSLLMAPFLFDSFEEADFVLDNIVLDKVKALFAEKGLHFIQWIDSGWFNLFSQVPVRVPDDVTDMRMRAAGGPAARVFLQEVGADVAQLPFADLVPGLQTGLLVGGATNTSMYRTVALYELAPYVTLTRHGINPGTTFANKAWFDAQPKADQALVMDGIAATKVLRSAVRTEDEEAVTFSAARGATIIELSTAERILWKKASADSHRILIDEIGGETASLYDLIQEGRSAFAAGVSGTGALDIDASR